LGIPVTLIAEAVFARCVSAFYSDRIELSKRYLKPQGKVPFNKVDMVEKIREALYAAKILSYTQGFMLMKAMADEMKWDLNFGSIAMMWREGCIIRSRFLDKIKQAYSKDPALKSFLYDPFFEQEIKKSISGLRETVKLGIDFGISLPALSSALSFFDGMTTDKLSANLLQAQRDFFGAHTYERVDKKRGEFFHTNWTGTGGNVSSSTYNA